MFDGPLIFLLFACGVGALFIEFIMLIIFEPLFFSIIRDSMKNAALVTINPNNRTSTGH